MREEIKSNLDNPNHLEKLYRSNKKMFKTAFDVIYPDIHENLAAKIWNERLNFEQTELSWGIKNELLFVIALSFIAGLIAKIPAFTGLNEEYFYPRNIAFIVFPVLMIYFAWKQTIRTSRLLIVSVIILAAALYINILPHDQQSDTLILACIHLPFFLWAILGYIFTGDQIKSYSKRIDFLRYNGDLVVMTTLILITGGVLSAVTVGLFELINLRIEELYFANVAIWGLAASPVLGTYLVRSNPHLVSNVSPVIAKVFTPLVLVMLIVYMVAIFYTGKDPYNDREFLLIFNLLLIGVMAIILFSIAETSKKSENRIGSSLLFMLSMVTIIINGIALSAIIFRISEWGITPNRLAVLGSNILMIVNLMVVAYRLFNSIRDPDKLEEVENSIAFFLPIYLGWTMVVIYILPFLFNFK